MKLIKKLYAKLSAFLFSSFKRRTKKAYKPVDINKYRNVYLSKDTYAQLVKLHPSPKPQAPSFKRQASSAKPKRVVQKIPGSRSTNQQ